MSAKFRLKPQQKLSLKSGISPKIPIENEKKFKDTKNAILAARDLTKYSMLIYYGTSIIILE